MKIDGLVEAGTKELGTRLILVGLLPSTLLALFVLALVWSGAPERPPDLSAIQARLGELEAKESLALVVVILVFSLVVQPLQLSLVRLLEGYWGDWWLARWLAALGIARHRRARQRLAAETEGGPLASDGQASPETRARAAAAAWQLRSLYPAEERLLPTTLGNALRAAEDLAGRRYGLDAVVVWVRLYLLLPDKTLALLADQRNQLDLAARFCAVFALAGLVSLVALLPHGPWLLVPVGAFGLAWLSYRAAIEAAVAYGQGIQAAFDLHRFELWKALHLPLPADRTAERRAGQELTAFLAQGRPLTIAYEHGAKPAAPAAAPPAAAKE